MKSLISSVIAILAMGFDSVAGAQGTPTTPAAKPPIETIDPPEKDFFSKSLSFQGIPIKSHAVVSNEALYAAYDRLARETEHLPMVVSNLAAAGAELHIIGRNQVTTDLPEWQHDKHVPLDEYNGLTRDQRTRGMGGLITSCGEENVLNLTTDRYRGSDICMHEFAHNIEGSGIPRSLRARFDEQYQKSKDKGLWLGSYAGSNPNEYFAELTMWYFGSHGSLNGLQGERPENGAEGLKKYDPEAFALLDDFYSGRIEVERVEPRARRPADGTNTVTAPRTPRDSLMARAIVAHLTSYKPGETKLADFYAHAGMAQPEDNGIAGWYVTQVEAETVPAGEGNYKFRVEYRAPPGAASRAATVVPAAAGTNTQTNAAARGNGGGGRRGANARSRGSIADLEFKDGVLAAFKWNN